MAGFGGFGNTPTGGMFGAKPPNQPTGGLSIPTTTAITTTTGLNFGTPTFGTKGATPLFGTSQQAPTFGSTPQNFSFGANTTLTSTAAPTFGTSGTSNNPTFGTTSFNFGTPNATAPAPFTLQSTAPATTTTATPFNFSFTSTSVTTASLTFGIPTSTTSTGTAPTVSFGLPTSAPASTSIPSTGFTFTQPATTNSSLAFGAPKTTGGFTFGTTGAPKTTGGFTFGTTGAPATTTTAKPLFNLTTTVAASTTTSTVTTTTTATTNISTPTAGPGLFGAPKTTEGISITTTTTTTSVGLGGVDKAQTTPGLSGAGTTEPKQAKDHTLPDPILQTLNEFQNFTKQQKSISVEISHGSSKPLKKVQEDTEAMESLLTTIMSGLTRNAIAVDKLKTETAQGLHQAEMAQRNNETPPSLDYDNSAPSDYFNDLVTKFENDTISLRVQIEASEKHLRSLTQSSTISPQELTLAMRRLHETLIVLAARVQALHTSVQSQKEQFKNLRRVYFKDDTNIFENDSDQNGVKKQTLYSLRSLTGPTPFSETPNPGFPLNVDGLSMLASSSGPANPTTTTNPTFGAKLN